MAEQTMLQKHKAVTSNPKAMSKADKEKDLPCKNFPFFPDKSHSSAHKVPRDGENYAP